ncbi:hypothetical protein HY967_03370 [Candidatus Jorgensenbacteria bacterium]|nr:hypothetical protein [Candidatus Jorgensenbacteria bacterium]
MDIISHALWGGTVIRKKPLAWLALLTGAAPDILGSGPAFVYLIVAHGKFWSSETWMLLPQILKDNYHFWHTILAAMLVGVFLLFWGKRFMIFIIPYLLHIVMDLFTHQTDMLSRLFSPFVQYNINRVSGLDWWEHPWISWTNLGLLVSVNMVLWYRAKRKIRAVV